MQAALETSASPLRVGWDSGGSAREPRGDRASGGGEGCCFQHPCLMGGGFLSSSPTPQMAVAKELRLRVFAVCQDRLARKRAPSEAKPEIKRAWLIVLAAAAARPGAERAGHTSGLICSLGARHLKGGPSPSLLDICPEINWA